MHLRMLTVLRRAALDRRAVTSLEYGIITGVLGIVLITVFTALGLRFEMLAARIGSSF